MHPFHAAADAAKKHPMLIAGGVFVVGLLWLMTRNSSQSAATTTGTAGPSAAQVAAAAQVQTAQVQGSYAEALANLGSQTQVQLANIAADTQNHGSDNALTAALAAVQEQMSKDNLTAGVEQAQLSDALKAHLSDNSLQDTANAYQYQLQYHEQNVQDNANAWAYTLQYQQNANTAANTAALTGILGSLVSQKAA